MMINLTKTAWRKSSRSSASGEDRVEVAGMPNGVAVRDSKDPLGPILLIEPEVWARFTRDARAGSHQI